ncbi:helix-turn-helix domain-containing protein [Thermococcus sp.]|uniref:helix-turn-helix domain-containing protein n=1 Tax=Thermococcus sp. TaxID=35749 RepID=UPI002627C303|nr:helix-turn-helix domain-containing protein [Thermococcus sp.]MCD6143596.1 helix-turn-helix domain-containing protein [Thermococcus sp.]
MEKLLTLREVSEKLQISENTLYKLARKGEIPGIKIGNQWRFKVQDIEKWLEEQKMKKKGNKNE